MLHTLEELSLNAWPALQTHLYDGWILRFANGYTKRSNSVSPLYPAKISLPEKIDYCETAYHLHELPVIFKLTPESQPGEIDRQLEARQYVRLDETAVRLLQMRDYQYRIPAEVISENRFSQEWLNGFLHCANLDLCLHDSAKAVLNHITGEVIVVRKEIGGRTVGCGFGAMERGYVGIFDIVVAPQYRGFGHGREIMDGILRVAWEKGVKSAYLSVVVGNTVAENLYQKLGFQEVYRYWYRKLEM